MKIPQRKNGGAQERLSSQIHRGKTKYIYGFI